MTGPDMLDLFTTTDLQTTDRPAGKPNAAALEVAA